MKLALVSAAVLVAILNACCPAVIAAPFICKTINADGSGTGSAVAVAKIPDADVKAGFRLTGGGCLDKSGGEHSGYLEKSVPDTTTYSYTCSVIGITAKADVRVSAYAVGCRSN